MTQSYWPFDAGVGSSIVESQWSKMARLWRSDGPVQGALNQLEVYADTSGMQVKAKTGVAWIEGHYFESDAQEILAIATANPTNPRIDRVIVRLNWTANTIALAVLTGTPGASPTPPALTQGSTTWEISLAQVYVAASAITINPTDVTDERTYSAGGASAISEPPGVIKQYCGFALPTGYLWCDGSAKSRSTYANLFAALTIARSGTMSAGSAVVTALSSTTEFTPGMDVEHANIPTGTKILSVDSGSQITLTANCTANQTSVITFFPWARPDATNFLLPDFRGRVMIGDGAATYAETVPYTNVNTSTDQITVANVSDHFYTGMAVVLTTSGTAPAGLTAGNTYYVIKISNSAIKLASSQANAVAGTGIDITSQGTGNHTLTYTFTSFKHTQKGGEGEHALVTNEIPAHNHLHVVTTGNVANTGSAVAAGSQAGNTGAAGGSGVHNNMPPFTTVKYIIKY